VFFSDIDLLTEVKEVLLIDRAKSSFLYGDSVRIAVLPRLLEFLLVVLLLFGIGIKSSGDAFGKYSTVEKYLIVIINMRKMYLLIHGAKWGRPHFAPNMLTSFCPDYILTFLIIFAQVLMIISIIFMKILFLYTYTVLIND
jgi:hypothetical protein